MKKNLLILVCAMLLLTVTGCGKKNQVVCSKTIEEDGEKVTMEVTAEFDKDEKITSASLTYDFGKEETAKTYCDIFKMAEEEGKSDAISCTGSKITIKDIDTFDEEDETEESEKIVGKAKSAFIESAKEEGFTCK